MTYRVIYKGADGNTLKDETFSADDMDDALELLANTPSLVPPPDTTDIHISLARPAPS